MVRIDAKIRSNPALLSDPQLSRVEQKIQASFDTMQVFSYETHTVEFGTEGPPHNINFQTIQDYSGPAKMTNNTIAAVQGIMQYQKRINY